MNRQIKASYYPAGDSALIIKLGSTISLDIHASVQTFTHNIIQQQFPFLVALIPSYNEILLQYNPKVIAFEQLLKTIKDLELNLQTKPSKAAKTVIIPVVYGGVYGPDMPFVMQYTGLNLDQIITIHSARTYNVYAIGFLPGFGYLGDLDSRLNVPRKTTPKQRVLTGSVGIVNRQTGIYPLESPGGWQIIGRTPLPLFVPDSASPFLFNIGDYVRFKPISEKAFKDIHNIKNERHEDL